ncbi:MAG TPA: hypothetical protein EYP21_00555 [Syntrophaceae bacterium]|nr:hypothetical protein [Syntrophaceae bacterium]
MNSQKDLEKSLRDISKKTSLIKRDLWRYSQLRQKGAPYLLRTVLESMERGLNSISNDFNQFQVALSQILENGKVTLKQKEEEFFFEFVKDLDDLFKEKGLTLSGQLPNLKVGFYHLKVNWEAKRVQIFFGPELVKSVPLDPEGICQAVVDFSTSMKKGLIQPEEFMPLLYKGYERALTTCGKEDGERLPIMEVLKEIVFQIQDEKFLSDPSKGNFKPLSRIQFAIQLYQLRREQILRWKEKDLHLVVAPFDATFKRQMFLWVPDNERGEGTRFSHILFK